MRMPTLFISHESPYLWDTSSPARNFLSSLSASLPRPKAILLVSAHWNTSQPTVSAAEAPETLYDFGGFPDRYSQIKYPATGSKELAARISSLANAAQISVATDDQRGLDHAAWIPLGIIFPRADIPVVSLSVQPRLPVSHHIQIGKMLRPLREEGILIIGSGTATHNLRAFFQDTPPALSAQPAEYAGEFADWLKKHIDSHEAIANYKKIAPFAAQCHPTNEHFLPLAVALGAGAEDKATCIHDSFNFSHFSMLSFRWG